MANLYIGFHHFFKKVTLSPFQVYCLNISSQAVESLKDPVLDRCSTLSMCQNCLISLTTTFQMLIASQMIVNFFYHLNWAANLLKVKH